MIPVSSLFRRTVIVMAQQQALNNQMQHQQMMLQQQQEEQQHQSQFANAPWWTEQATQYCAPVQVQVKLLPPRSDGVPGGGAGDGDAAARKQLLPAMWAKSLLEGTSMLEPKMPGVSIYFCLKRERRCKICLEKP